MITNDEGWLPQFWLSVPEAKILVFMLVRVPKSQTKLPPCYEWLCNKIYHFEKNFEQFFPYKK